MCLSRRMFSSVSRLNRHEILDEIIIIKHREIYTRMLFNIPQAVQGQSIINEAQKSFKTVYHLPKSARLDERRADEKCLKRGGSHREIIVINIDRSNERSQMN